MSDTPDARSCSSRESHDGASAPFTSIHYHYGMLLGVADFETEQAYHRGKMHLHNGWLHREGVVWGFDVRSDPAHGEIRVTRGLALDPLGRELHLDAEACLNVVAWFNAHRQDEGFEFEQDAQGTIRFDAHVLLRFKTCLTRQVPALSGTCEDASAATAYSRVFETVEILLRPKPAPPRTAPYPRLRLHHGLTQPRRDPATGEIHADDARVLATPRTLAGFHQLAALDTLELEPPDAAEYPVPLANVTRITLVKDGETLRFTGAQIDVSVRPSHVATATLQELIHGPVLPATSPRVVPGSVSLTAADVEFRVDHPFAPASVTPASFVLSAFEPATGWSAIPLGPPVLSNADSTVTLTVGAALPAGSLLRFLIRGTGPTPLLGADLTPFNHGLDYVHDQPN